MARRRSRRSGGRSYSYGWYMTAAKKKIAEAKKLAEIKKLATASVNSGAAPISDNDSGKTISNYGSDVMKENGPVKTDNLGFKVIPLNPEAEPFTPLGNNFSVPNQNIPFSGNNPFQFPTQNSFQFPNFPLPFFPGGNNFPVPRQNPFYSSGVANFGSVPDYFDYDTFENPYLAHEEDIRNLYARRRGNGGRYKRNWNKKLSAKSVSQLWMNAQSKMNYMPAEPEEDDEDDEDMGVAETYADYMPSKLKIGKKHPDPVVETSSLSSVEPGEVLYDLSLPKSVIQSGALSALQLEAITYACQQHDHFLPDGSRAGFLIGDGAGVGKGRTIAGIIYENYLKGRDKSIWVSVSNDLKYDSERDLNDIGASEIQVYSLNKMKYAKIASATNGKVQKGVIFSTYASLVGETSQTTGKYKTRLSQLLDWCGPDFDGLIVFDECHRAKNLCPTGNRKPTKTGLNVLELQNKLPKARVVYSSATGASEPQNMAYMIRLGIWGEGTPFEKFDDFIKALERRGVGAMEIVAMDMKLRGMYIARQLSFHGVSFQIEEVGLSEEYIEMYDKSVKLWVKALEKFNECKSLVEDQRLLKSMWGQFWSAHQRFFKYLCIAAKVQAAVKISKEAMEAGKCVVIGLQSTGEARTLEQLERDDWELSDFVSTAKGVLQALIEKHFPAPDRRTVKHLFKNDSPKKHSPKKGKSKRKRAARRAAAENLIKRFKMPSDSDTDIDEDFESESKKRSTRSKAKTTTATSGKKKTGNRKGKPGTKRSQVGSSSDEPSEDSDNSSGSDFKLSDESESEESSSEDSHTSSDFKSDLSEAESDTDSLMNGMNDKEKKLMKINESKMNTYLRSKYSKTKKLLDADSTTEKNNVSALLPVANPHTLFQNQSSATPFRQTIETACTAKEELLKDIEELGGKLPPNTLDYLIDELGGPECVAEMTGRKGRVVQSDDGVKYETRSDKDVALEALNLKEKQRFMDGEKLVAIISEAASSGISLQSDRRALNKRRRVHITLELPWSADRAIQQFGRTHRSNQVNAPEYVFLISDLAGERRFASIVAKRLESLGALTHGDRRATETRDFSRYNFDNKYGRLALHKTMKVMQGYEAPLIQAPEDYKGEFFVDVAEALDGVGLTSNELITNLDNEKKHQNTISKFLNRILGMPVDLQNRLFKYFTDTLDAIIRREKKLGRYDLGILDLGAGGENVKRVKLHTFMRKHATGVAKTELHTVQVERGLSWTDALEKYNTLTNEDEGFYLSYQIRNGKHTAILAVSLGISKTGVKGTTNKKNILFSIHRPNTGLQLRQETLGELEKKYRKVTTEEAEKAWTQQYESSSTICSHAYWSGRCKSVIARIDCEVGLRRRTYNVLSGSVLSVWTRVENILANSTTTKMQVVRLRTAEGVKIVGTLIPKSCMESLIEALASDAEDTEEETY